MRALAMVAALLVAQPAAAFSPQDGEVLRFEVLRKGQPFGAHIVRFDRDGETLTVTVDIDLDVKLGPLSLFKYRHDVVEKRRDGALVSLRATTLKDGERFSIDLKDPPGELIPTTHWNRAVLARAAMVNTETGEMLDFVVREMGVETIVAEGRQIEANRYRIDAEIPLDIWYDADGRWVKLAFTVRDQPIEYVLTPWRS